MGVPGYFSWIHRKYPWQVRKVKRNGRKKHIDCLYIDVNGICYQYARDEHLCNYLLNPKPLEAIFKQVIDHIDSIIELVEPQLQVYLMMDGPCPRAKMNQQRQRRFHAQDHHVVLKEGLKRHGFDVKEESVPNNSIAPGTPFMYELNEQIKKYIETRIALSNQAMTEDEAGHKEHSVIYKKLQFILSDSNAPGEGEHKILEIIRKHTNLQLTHCIVGADADLLLLSLATIGKRILILRESNKFSGDKADLDQELEKLKEELKNAQEHESRPKDYDMVDINGLKRVILDKYKKMFDNKQVQNLKYNPMSIMDDFVFLSLFAGNDFLPRQNYMQIKNDKRRQHILDMLIEKYDSYLETATTYLSDRGFIKYGSIIEFFRLVASIEPQFKNNRIFELPAKEEKSVFEYVKIMSQKQISDVENIQDNDLVNLDFKEDDLKLQQSHSQAEEVEIVKDIIPESDSEDDSEEKKFDSESPTKDPHQHKKEKKHHHGQEHSNSGTDLENKKKKNAQEEDDDEITKILSDELNGKEIYLKEKLKVTNQKEYDLIIMKYLEGFEFTLLYYFRGIEKASWNYYYPHFYAPLTQDVVEFLERNPKFEVKFLKTQPFQPFKQLLAILHPDNEELLPAEFKGLFHKHLHPFCPEKLDIDKYGATMDHMQIIKLPFIDLHILENAYEEGAKALEHSKSDFDKNRNKFSQDLLFEHDQNVSITIPVFNKLVHHTKIENAHVREIKFNHLDVTLPDKLTNLHVDMDKKNAERQQFEQKRNQKKRDFSDSDNPQYEKKERHHYKKGGEDSEERHGHGKKDHHHKKDYQQDDSENKHTNKHGGHHHQHHKDDSQE